MSGYIHGKSKLKQGVFLGVLLSATLVVTGCGASKDFLNTSQTYTEGYVIDQDALDTVKPGSSRDQVLLALGSPSVTAMYDNEVFYYISQTRYRGAQFLKSKVVDRRILAVYFDKKGTVTKIANYGLQDGKLFDFISRTTPTGGHDESFLGQLIKGPAPTSSILPPSSR